MLIVGVDPGISGSIAFLNEKLQFLAAVPMPVMAYGKHQQVNGAAVAKIFKFWSGKADSVMVYMEQPQPIKGQGITSSCNFMMGFGVLQGVLAALGIPYKLVRPQEWKKQAGLIRQPKDMSRTLAQKLYPEVSLSKKKDIHKAEAILIAVYGEKKGE